MSRKTLGDGCLPNLPSVHVQIHPFRFLKPAKVGDNLSLLHRLTLQVPQALHKLDALVILAAHERLLGRVQVQLLQGGLSQQAPGFSKDTENLLRRTNRQVLYQNSISETR